MKLAPWRAISIKVQIRPLGATAGDPNIVRTQLEHLNSNQTTNKKSPQEGGLKTNWRGSHILKFAPPRVTLPFNWDLDGKWHKWRLTFIAPKLETTTRGRCHKWIKIVWSHRGPKFKWNKHYPYSRARRGKIDTRMYGFNESINFWHSFFREVSSDMDALIRSLWWSYRARWRCRYFTSIYDGSCWLPLCGLLLRISAKRAPSCVIFNIMIRPY